MKKIKSLITAILCVSILASSCSKKKDEVVVEDLTPQTIKGDITTNTLLTANKTWILEGYVRVLNGATLTIEAGTVIKGDKVTKGALIIERGGKIMAEGTASKPIVFTSNQAVGSRAIGDWSGVIICGKAPVNFTGGEGQYEGGILGAETAKYGGTIANDNSGVLKFVRIEYAGIAIQQDREINSLTLAGVGSGTVVENVQVSYGGDDGFEWFGGTVNCKNLVAYRCTDDDFDFEFGYVGRIQYAISIKDPNVFDASATGASNGIECDNGTNVTDIPANKPLLSNFTFIGPGVNANTKHNAGVLFRKGTRFVLRNSIIVDHLKSGFTLATVQAGDNLFKDESEFKNNLVFCATANSNFKVSSAGTNFATDAILRDFLLTPSNANAELASLAAAGITSATLLNPILTLTSTSPAKTGASFTGLTGFDVVNFRGAMDTNNWASGWANFDPQNVIY
ncbi:MAG: T9SS C-terminal target domain-containing protein [Sphingobacteriales bacterium]|nr:MAG: T9SS C-terminal target domain-containing protein [Sphingobacteriales bacterium]TAF79819.1 MAG: T9SS C-terminal target domain-containing protein [Sphingobacteriales bacterium]